MYTMKLLIPVLRGCLACVTAAHSHEMDLFNSSYYANRKEDEQLLPPGPIIIGHLCLFLSLMGDRFSENDLLFDSIVPCFLRFL